jgi:hypothetical protein
MMVLRCGLLRFDVLIILARSVRAFACKSYAGLMVRSWLASIIGFSPLGFHLRGY